MGSSKESYENKLWKQRQLTVEIENFEISTCLLLANKLQSLVSSALNLLVFMVFLSLRISTSWTS